MVYNNIYSQRDTFKLVETLSHGKFHSETALLKALVKHIVDDGSFEITGGRVWELNPQDKTYKLNYQYGNLKKIPKNYSIQISEHPVFSKLLTERTILQRETDNTLREKGIEVYSATGVGEIVRLKNGKYFKYALGFSAPQILQSFFETLSIISSVASVALRNLSSQALQKRMQHDILKASEIQRSLLPEHYMEYKDYKIFGACIPDAEVGGDYFDYLKSSDEEEDNLGIVVCDAASKGLPAAIQALFVSGAMRMGRGFTPKISQLMSHINTLVFDTFPYERFVTLFYCELTSSKNRLVLYANAGHCAPIHFKPSRDRITMLNATGGLMGIMQYQRFEVENIIMDPGDVLVLYTDGITEARNETGELFGENRLIDIIKNNHLEKPDTIAYKILQEVQTFASEHGYTDDRTLVVIKRDPPVEG